MSDTHGTTPTRWVIAAVAIALVVLAVVVGLVLWTTPGPDGDRASEGETAAPTEMPSPGDTPFPGETPGATETPLPGETPEPGPGPSGPAAPPDVPADCAGDGDGATTVEVNSGEELETALAEVTPGSVIHLSPGVYSGRFIASVSGTEREPIALCGSEDSVLDGGNPQKGYVLHLDGVSHWVLSGFAIQNGQKGLMADATTFSLIDGLTVSQIGDEAIHLRGFSTDNTVSNNRVSDTGLRKPKFGEGIYLGTAESNWCDISECEPDRSDRNVVRGNSISGTTSESIDIKEGTSDGVIEDNRFDGSAITAADSWVDVKGNGYLIRGNSGTNSPGDGFQTHEIVDGWGTDNTFRDNSAEVNGPGHGYALKPVRGNVVDCSNTASGGAEGLSNVSCTR
jgi:hypothetical protein